MGLAVLTLSRSATKAASEIMACTIRAEATVGGDQKDVNVYKDFECHVDGKGVCISEALTEIRQKFRSGPASQACLDTLTPGKKWKVSGVCSGSTLVLDDCGLRSEIVPSRIGTCAWCDGQRTVDKAAKVRRREREKSRTQLFTPNRRPRRS